MTLSDYEILVLKKLKKGKSVGEIAKELGLPEPIVRIAIERVKNKELPKKRIELTKSAIFLLIDAIILYVLLKILIEVAKWFL